MAPLSRTGQSSARRPTRTSAEGFSLKGPSALPDPATHAYRQDLADVALAGRVIASHYAEPIRRQLTEASPLRSAASDSAEVTAELPAGTAFEMLDDTLGWAWGYAGDDRRVGYVKHAAIGPV